MRIRIQPRLRRKRTALPPRMRKKPCTSYCSKASSYNAYFSHFLRAQIDALKLSGRQIILWVAVGSLGAVLVVSALVMGVVLFLSGLATGVGTAVGGNIWLGQLIVGLGFLILFGLVILLGWSRLQSRSRSQKVQDYAERQQQQRLQFGHSVAERANHSAV